MEAFFTILAVAVVILIVIRFFGAWMLRINDVISNQEVVIQQNDEIIKLLRGKQITNIKAE